MRRLILATVSAVALALAGPAQAQFGGSAAAKRLADLPRDPFPSTYAPQPSVLTAIVGATAHIGTGTTVNNATLVMNAGKIVSVTEGGAVPDGAVVIDGKGKYVTPGLIDAHSHLGVYPEPSINPHDDGNEATDPNTAEVWAEHSVWPQDPAFSRALAGGVTTMQILPGSANLIGGRSVVLKNVWSRSVQGMKFPGAKQGMKMACGENPKRVYGSKNRAPATRMGNFAGYRTAWIKALEYQYEWDQFEQKRQKGDPAAKPPKRDLELETLAGALRGDILVQMHCYRADEMMQVIDMSKEFGYRTSQFHHAVEAYKIRDVLAKEKICGALWSDWFGFKLESFDGIPENIAMMEDAGACAVLHSDSNITNQRLHQDAAKVMGAGRRMGLNLTEGQAIKWVTLNPARSIAIDDKTGSLEPGKMADVVVWSGSPLSVYTHAEKVFIDGALTYDYDDPSKQARGDFELGLAEKENVR
jgi:imidazolonepropionase-like amidohydrolase